MTVPTRPEHSRGWQATPGQPIPRAARQPAANGLLLVLLLLVWFSPLSIVAWLLGQGMILLQPALALVALHPGRVGGQRCGADGAHLKLPRPAHRISPA
jgi:hypothetical protein